jgi:hypothetical protein
MWTLAFGHHEDRSPTHGYAATREADVYRCPAGEKLAYHFTNEENGLFCAVKEFFCYRQHDDTTAPEFFEVLLQAVDMEPNAAAVYCDCQFSGGRHDIESAPSIEGESLHRMFRYMENVPSSAAPVRGLMRRAAIQQAGLVRSDEFRAPLEVFVWLAKLLRWGNFRRVAKPLYYRLDHPRSFTSAYISSPEDRKREPC